MIQTLVGQIMHLIEQTSMMDTFLQGKIPDSLNASFDEAYEEADEETRVELNIQREEFKATIANMAVLCDQAMATKARQTYRMYQAYMEAGFSMEQATHLVTHQGFNLQGE